jgi:transposase
MTPRQVRASKLARRQLLGLKKQILEFDRMILAWHRSNQTSKRLNCIPGVGPLLATALVASVLPRPVLIRADSEVPYRVRVVPFLFNGE